MWNAKDWSHPAGCMTSVDTYISLTMAIWCGSTMVTVIE